ncbi:MAG: hypothetical protein IKT84_03490 [Bacteroidales bacterium]|nr:hypothetical protein [Bacteroidales bacterium]
MRKITLIVALIGLSIAANAQTVKLQSAISDLRNGRLNKAKANIDAAAEHEDTKNDPKTWIYKGLIYCQLGAPDVKDKYKGLCDNCFEVAYEAALRCKELDQTNEYKELNNSVFRAVGGAYYNNTVDTYTAATQKNDTNLYREAIRMAEEVIKINNNSGDKSSTGDAYWIAGLSAEMLKDATAIEKYYKILVRQKTDKERVYKALFDLYRSQNDTTKALNIASTYSTKNQPNDFKSHLLMSTAYLWVGNVDKAKESANTAIEKVSGSTDSVKGLVYCQIGNILNDAKEFELAHQNFNNALSLANTGDIVKFEANHGLGILYYNEAANYIEAANAVPLDDQTGKYDELLNKSKEQFQLAIPHFTTSMKMVENDKYRIGHYVTALRALKTIYTRLEMQDQLSEITNRLKAIGLDN